MNIAPKTCSLENNRINIKTKLIATTLALLTSASANAMLLGRSEADFMRSTWTARPTTNNYIGDVGYSVNGLEYVASSATIRQCRPYKRY